MTDKLFKDLIDQAKNKKPLSVTYKGSLSEREIELLNNNGCTVHCLSAYMDRSAVYSIKFEKIKSIRG